MHNSRIKGEVCTEEKKERLKAQKLNKEKEKKRLTKPAIRRFNPFTLNNLKDNISTSP